MNANTNETKAPEAPQPDAAGRKSSPGRRGKRRYLRVLLGAAGVLALLIIAALLYVPSEHFLRHFVVPRIESATGRAVEFQSADLKVLRGIVVDNLSVGGLPGEPRPLLDSDRIVVQWKFWPLLGKKLHLKMVSATGLSLNIPRQPDSSGKPNPGEPGDRPKEEEKPDRAEKNSRGWDVTVDNLRVSSGTVAWYQPAGATTGTARLYALENLEIDGSSLGIGRPAELDLRARIKASDPAEETDLTDGRVMVVVDSELQPRDGAFAINGQWSIQQLEGRFRGLEAEDLRATGVLALKQTDPTSLTIQRADAALFYKGRRGALIALNGGINPRTNDGRLVVDVTDVNSLFLNLLSTRERPLDFRQTRAEAHLELIRADRGDRLGMDGDIVLADFSVSAPSMSADPIPPTQIDVHYRSAYFPKEDRLAIDRLSATARQQDREIVAANLTQPMRFTLRADGEIAADSPASLTLRIDRLDLAQMNPWMAADRMRIRSGALSVDAALAVTAAGMIDAQGELDLNELRASLGDRDLGRTDVLARYTFFAGDGTFDLRNLDCSIRKDGEPAGNLSGSGRIALDGGSGQIAVQGEKIDLDALQVFLADLSVVRIRSGTVNFNQKVTASGPEKPLGFAGRFDVASLTFDLPDKEAARFENWSLSGGNDLAYNPANRRLDLTRLQVEVAEPGQQALKGSGDGQIAFAEGEGTVNLRVEQVGAPFLDSVLERLGSAGGDALRTTAGTVSGNTRIDLARNFSDMNVTGSLETKDLAWVSGEASAAGDLGAQYNIAYSRENKRLEVAKTQLRVTWPDRPGGTVAVDGRLDLDSMSGDLNFDFQQFDTQPVLALAGSIPGKVIPQSGILDGRESVSLAAGLSRIGLKGQLRVDRLQLEARDVPEPLAPIGVVLDHDIALVGPVESLELNRLRLRNLQTGTSPGSLEVNGLLNLKRKNTTLNIEAQRFETQPLWPILAAFGPDLPLSGGRLDGSQSVRYSADQALLEARGNLSMDQVTFRQLKEGVQAPARFDLTNDLTLGPEKTDVRSLALTTYAEGKPLDRITVSATGGGLKSKETMNVSIEADRLHLAHFLALIPSGEKDGEEPGRVATPGPPDRPSTAGAGAKIPGPPVNASAKIGEFVYDRYAAKNLDGRFGLTGEGVTVYNLTGNLADGSASGTGWLRTDVPKPAFQLTLAGTDVDSAKLFAMFAPGLEEKISGRGATRFDISGIGFGSEELRQNLRSEGWFRIEKGQWKDTPILNALAAVTQIESLANVNFFQFDGQWRIAQGVVTIPEALVTGQLQKIRIKGDIGFDKKIDLTFDLWLGGQLADRLKDRKIFKYLVVDQNQFLRLPVPIGMAGTMSKPRPSLNLPAQAILDIGVDQGLRYLEKYLKERQE